MNTDMQALLMQLLTQFSQPAQAGTASTPAGQINPVMELVANQLASYFKERQAEQALSIDDATVCEEPSLVYNNAVHTAVARNRMLALALGACDCWGEDEACAVCRGDGAPGWTLPERRAFDYYVRPALQTMRRCVSKRTAPIHQHSPANQNSHLKTNPV